jgi:hypothetical protein
MPRIEIGLGWKKGYLTRLHVECTSYIWDYHDFFVDEFSYILGIVPARIVPYNKPPFVNVYIFVEVLAAEPSEVFLV